MLSNRLKMNVSLVPKGTFVADIGCDHGYAAIELISKEIACHVIAMDIRKGPLQRAKENIEKAGLSDIIECRLSDGMEKLNQGEADTLLIAGMGGTLIIHILEARPELLHRMKSLVLQPQSQIELVRHFLHKHNFEIQKEKMVCEDGKYYTALFAVPGNQHFSENKEYLFGKYLLDEGNLVLLEYLQKEWISCKNIMKEMQRTDGEKAAMRLAELKEREQEIKHSMQRIQDVISDGTKRVSEGRINGR